MDYPRLLKIDDVGYFYILFVNFNQLQFFKADKWNIIYTLFGLVYEYCQFRMQVICR